jgi:CubicO group peptidase (beta-lactamase class C family)
MKRLTLIPKIFLTMILPLAFIISGLSCTREKEKSTPPQTIAELRSAIEKTMEETKTPAVGLALVNQDGPVWIAGLGKADVEKNVDAHENTMFRIGSVSKMFVALSVLKLQEQGRISLKDKVRELAPDVEFTNRWEDSHPILVEHLLEHTTGWNDLHLTEFAHNDPAPVRLKDGLDYHPHSRTSRWIPGTRMAYCNAGPSVAAYIVEKITGQSYEDYVQKNFFQPMGMKNMTFFASDMYKQLGATLYQNGKPQEYWHVIMRPTGAINASPVDMAKMVQFFIHRGMVDSVQLISQASLKRMETPTTSTGARAGLESGYGLNNYSTLHKSFVYRTHEGAVNGGLTDFSYLPEQNAGYALMINSGSIKALQSIAKLIRDFQTKEFESTEIIYDSELTQQHAAVSGYYIPVNPRNQELFFLERILSVWHIYLREDTVFQKGLLGGKITKYLPSAGIRYKSAEAGLISIVQVTDPLAGDVIHSGEQVLKRVSPIMAIGQLTVTALWLLFMVSAVIFGLVWPILYWRGKITGGANIRVRLWPLLASICILCFFLVFALRFNSLDLGKVNPASVAIMLSSIGFAVSSVWSVLSIIKERKASVHKLVYWHSAILSGLHLIVTCYFLWHGVIGFRTWA